MTRASGRTGAGSVGLVPRIVGLLLLVLVPLGVLAVTQTRALALAAERSAARALLYQTEAAAAGQREVIERAFGLASALAGLEVSLGEDLAECRAMMRDLVRDRELLAFAGFIQLSGRIDCMSGPGSIDLGDRSDWAEMIADPRERVSVNEEGAVSGRWVVVVSMPVYRQGALKGYVSVSVPYAKVVADGLKSGTFGRPLELGTFNSDGEIVTAIDAAGEPIALSLPAEAPLLDFVGDAGRSFRARDDRGRRLVYAVTPVMPGTLYAIGVYDPPEPRLFGVLAVPGALWPVAMWVATVAVAYVALNRSVVRHVRALGLRMRRFATERTLSDGATSRHLPAEIAGIEADFAGMAEAILQDEALLEQALRDKAALLKEVHHRVRNNLQLMSSIMGMQMRGLADGEARAIVERLQERVLSLAAVHRSLYLAEDMSRVDAAALLGDVLDQQLAIGDPNGDITVRRDLAPLALLPDQAVPLALLTAEAFANALDAAGGGGPASVAVRLERAPAGRSVTLAVSNSFTADRSDRTPGLGTGLIQAFAGQLGGSLVQERREDRFHVSVSFDVLSEIGPAQDY